MFNRKNNPALSLNGVRTYRAEGIWGLYARYVLLMLLLLPTMAVFNAELSWLSMLVNSASLWPAAFFGSFALIFFLVSLMQNKGLAYLVWGNKLKLSTAVWRRFNLMLVALFIALAGCGWLFSMLLNPQLWSLYKLYGQPVLLLLWPLLGARFAVAGPSST